jgi:thiosulfate/3-mercaptopyruvate sulfurtransferase
MNLTTLISASELQRLLQGPRPPVLLDCSFDLADTGAGRRAYLAGHLPGAHYLHLDEDLSSPRVVDGPRSPRFTGRHPLPDRQAFAACIGVLGIGPDTPVVAFDGQGGVYASRAWWLLRWLGHRAVAVLDGGTSAWLAAGGTLSDAVVGAPGGASYPAGESPAMPTVDAAALQAALGRVRVLDARAAERFRGEVEPLDPVAGHIPGATQRFFKDNLAADGRFKPAAQLRDDFLAPGAAGGPGVVHQCGSGVTACHNLLAMEHAGLAGSALYPGSWSEWCADPARPIARG